MASKKTVKKKPTDFEIFAKLNDAVAAEYYKDSCKAGVVTSRIREEPPLYYAAVARYHDHHSRKEIVCSTNDISMEQALRRLADEWLKKVLKPVTAEELKRQLKVSLATS